jgi:hypothetical protein
LAASTVKTSTAWSPGFGGTMSRGPALPRALIFSCTPPRALLLKIADLTAPPTAAFEYL